MSLMTKGLNCEMFMSVEAYFCFNLLKKNINICESKLVHILACAVKDTPFTCRVEHDRESVKKFVNQ